jgi:hypothetical protein
MRYFDGNYEIKLTQIIVVTLRSVELIWVIMKIDGNRWK